MRLPPLPDDDERAREVRVRKGGWMGFFSGPLPRSGPLVEIDGFGSLDRCHPPRQTGLRYSTPRRCGRAAWTAEIETA